MVTKIAEDNFGGCIGIYQDHPVKSSRSLLSFLVGRPILLCRLPV